MAYRAALLLPVLAGALAAQYGTSPKASARDYPAHASVDRLSLGAEYLVHSFSSGRQMYIARDYLVVEVALFPAKGESFVARAADFSLRVNGRKPVLSPQSPEIVANELKYPDRNARSGMESTEQVGPVIFGQPRPAERFPGDPNAQTRQPLPRAPDDNPTGQEREPQIKAEELVVQAAWPEGEHHGPASGFLYFPYRGKISRIRTVELLIAGASGSTTLALPLE
jgi:hypothetical protein